MMYFSPALFDKSVPTEYQIVSVIAALFILIKHRSNYSRLLKGTEARFGQKVNLEGNQE
jgi:glycerol-3-phosphate acyltransferase PlsY